VKERDCKLSSLASSGTGGATPDEEELLRWISTDTPNRSSFAGDMVTMSMVNLMTSRPVVNHPHFEDAAVRRRTEAIYQVNVFIQVFAVTMYFRLASPAEITDKSITFMIKSDDTKCF
jgi:hypothetical protein